jgi:ArsR family transcriptional regulator, lead/cadmium/zinc/bismuth-responsive transcriptional repressor
MLSTLTVDADNTSRTTTMAAYRKLEGKSTQLLEKIRENLERLNEKIDVMIEIQKHGPKELPENLPEALDVMTLLSLPDHLRKTAVTFCKLDKATADEISEQTKRARAVESGYLNQLVIMGYLKKERQGRKAYFYVDKET